MRAFFLSGIGAILLTSICAQSSCAQGQTLRVPARKLDKAEWFHAPPEIQVLDESPNVRYFPRNNTSATYVIDPTLQNTTTVLPTVHLGQGNSMQSALPHSGFGSNIPSGSVARPGLPAARSTNLLAGKMAAPASAPSAPSQKPPAMLTHAPAAIQPAAMQPTPAAQYPSSAPVFGASSIKTRTSVAGSILRKAR